MQLRLNTAFNIECVFKLVSEREMTQVGRHWLRATEELFEAPWCDLQPLVFMNQASHEE